MTLKCIATGSTGNCYVLTSDSGEKLILDAGIPIAEIKKGIDFDVENTKGCIITHFHKDHLLSADKVGKFTPVWKPYQIDKPRLRTHMGGFQIDSFRVPHNGIPNCGYLITVDGQKILYMTDYELCPYSMTNVGINIALIELNYQMDRITDMNEHRQHTVLGHAEEKTVIDFLSTIKKTLRKVYLCHMSKSEALDRELAMKHIREVIPEYISVEYCKANTTYNISEIPF